MGRKSSVGSRNQLAGNGEDSVADGSVRSSDSNATSDTVILKWTGAGFIPGIPACDLTQEEADKYGGVEYLISTRIYVQEVNDGTSSISGNARHQVPSENPDWSGDDAGDSSHTNEDSSGTRGDVE